MKSDDIHAQKSALVVLGMHRSGTSAMAGVLSLYGAKAPSNPLPPSGTNASGYFESEPVTKLNDEVLSELDASWDDIFAGQPKSYISNFDHFYRHKAAELLQSEYSGTAGTIVLKDPRINVLVGLWDRALKSSDYNPFYIIMVRHPMEVAHSLRVRDHIPVEQGLLLWLDNMVAAERDTRGSKRIFVTYEDLLNGWISVVDRIERASGVPLPKRTPAASNKVGLFLSSDKRNHQIDPSAEGQGDFWPRIKIAYDWFYHAAHDDTGQASSEPLDELAAELRNFYGFLGPVLAAQQSKLVESKTEISEFRKHTRGLEQLVEHLRHSLDEGERNAESVLADQQSKLFEANTEIAEFRKHTKGLEQLVEHLRHSLDEGERTADIRQSELALKADQIATLQRAQSDSEAKMRNLQQELEHLRAQETLLTDRIARAFDEAAAAQVEAEQTCKALAAEQAAQRAAEEESEALSRRHQELRDEVFRLQALSEEMLSRNRRSDEAMSRLTDAREQLALELNDADIRIATLNKEVTFFKEERAFAQSESDRQIAILEQQAAAAREREHDARQAVDHILSSKSWKLTSLPRRLITSLTRR